MALQIHQFMSSTRLSFTGNREETFLLIIVSPLFTQWREECGLKVGYVYHAFLLHSLFMSLNCQATFFCYLSCDLTVWWLNILAHKMLEKKLQTGMKIILVTAMESRLGSEGAGKLSVIAGDQSQLQGRHCKRQTAGLGEQKPCGQSGRLKQ